MLWAGVANGLAGAGFSITTSAARGNNKAKAEQLLLAVEERGTNAADFDGAVHQFFDLRRGQLPGLGRESFATHDAVKQSGTATLLQAAPSGQCR